MRVIENNLLPFPGFLAINLFGAVFVRKDKWGETNEYYRMRVLNHEGIHTAQMKELWYVGFYILYFLEWVYRLVFHTKSAYSGISFEKEAYEHEGQLYYLSVRQKFAQWKKQS